MKPKKEKLLSDEYTDDMENNRLLRQSLNKWDIKVGHSPTPPIGWKLKYRDANWMP